MRLGQAAMEALRAEITGCLKPGDELVVACPVALKGTSVIAKNKKDKLAERFSAGFIQNCVSLWDAGKLRRRQMPAHYMLWARAVF